MINLLNNDIPTKADLLKLKLKRRVTEDTDELGKALEQLAKLVGSKATDLGPPLHKFSVAFKEFKIRNSKKHPKFVADLQSDYQDAVDSVVKEMDIILSKSKDIRTGLTECETFAKGLITELKKPLDTASLKAAIKMLAGFGSVLGGVYDNTRVVSTRTGAKPYEEILTKIAGIRSLKEPVDRVLSVADSKGNTSFDTTPLLERCNKMHALVTSAKRQLG